MGRAVLAQHSVEVCAPEAESRQAGQARLAACDFPLTCLGGYEDRCTVKGDLGIRLLEVQRSRDDALVNGEGRLDQRGSTGGALEMADLALDRSHGDRVPGGAGPAVELSGQVTLGPVAGDGGCSMGLEHGNVGGRDAAVFVGALECQQLAGGVGGRDSLALAVRGTAQAVQHGVDLVAVALGVYQALEQQHAAALAHDETVRPFIERAAQLGRQRANLGELDETVRGHARIGAARQNHVVAKFRQAVDGCLQGGQGRGAGCVGGVVRPAQAEDVGHPAGDDVGQLAGHAVFGDRRQTIGE